MNSIGSSILGLVPSRFLQFLSLQQQRSRTLRRICAWGASWVKGQDATILRGAGKGLRFNVAASHSAFILGNHEPEVQELLANILRPGMTYYDVGANVGFFAVIAARLLGPAGRVFCFEPLPDNARQIEYNSRLNGFSNISVRCQALGGSNRTDVFNTSDEPTWGMLSTVGKLPEQASGQIEVEVRTMDSLCGPGGLPLPDVIQVDIEGAEAEFLEGAWETLSASRPVLLIELHGTNQAVTAVLDRLGYVYAVLGSSISVQDVPYDANIVAVPQERHDLVELARPAERTALS
ncbi:MAG: FkbM family methyltransferase [Bryobacteraceae bacterium]